MQLKGHKVIYFSVEAFFYLKKNCFYVSPICQIMNVLLEKKKKKKERKRSFFGVFITLNVASFI